MTKAIEGQIGQEAADLLEILDHEKKDYENLLQHSLKKQKVLLSNDIEELASITTEEEELIQGIQQLENERLRLLNGIAVEFNIPVDELNLTKLAELTDPGLSDRFVVAGEQLKAILEEISSVNRTNSKLILDSLAFTTAILDVITQQDREKSTYKKRGQKERSRLPLVLDRRA